MVSVVVGIRAGAPLKWTIESSQLRELYELVQSSAGEVTPVKDSSATDESAPLVSANNSSRVSANAGSAAKESPGVLLHELVVGGDGVALELEFLLGGDEQRPHLHELLKAVASATATDRDRQQEQKEQQQQDKLLQALVQLAPASPIRLSAHLQPSSYTSTAVLPKDAKALVLRSLHLARLACSLQLDSSHLQDALMMLRPASLEGWGLRDTAISGIDAELQVDTAEGKEEPSVRFTRLVAVVPCTFWLRWRIGIVILDCVRLHLPESYPTILETLTAVLSVLSRMYM